MRPFGVLNRRKREWMVIDPFDHRGRWLWVPAFAGTTKTKISNSNPLRHHHVVHVHVRGEAPAVGKWAVDHAGLFGDVELVVVQVMGEFVAGDALVPLMGAA